VSRREIGLVQFSGFLSYITTSRFAACVIRVSSHKFLPAGDSQDVNLQ